MQSSITYKPYRTDERSSPLSEDLVTKHRVALFELLRTDSYEKRQEALAQIGANLISWTQLAYPNVANSTYRPYTNGRARSRSPTRYVDQDTSDGVFNLDPDEGWPEHGHPLLSRKASSVSLTPEVRAQSPPLPITSNLHTEPGYGDYSMYGVDATIFNKTRPSHELKEVLKSYFLMVLRASIDCPFADVRRYCRYILHRVHSLGACVPDAICKGPSWLIPAVETTAFAYESTTDRSPANRALRTDGHSSPSKSSWRSSSFNSLSDCNDGPLKRIRSEIITPLDSPIQLDSKDESLDLGEMDDIVFEFDEDDGHGHSRSTQGSDSPRSQSSSTSNKVGPSAIPIHTTSKKANRAPVDSSEIDNILLGPLESRQNRKTRFSLDHDSPRENRRPALSRKRTNSMNGTVHQRRANRTLRAFHLNCYFSTGRISNFGRVISYFPRFYESTIVLHDELIRKQGGPLQRITKLYLSIMAAAQASCQYLVSYFTKKFLQLGQNSSWLEGLHKAPRKLQRLGKIAAILAHKPWLVKKESIDELLARSKESLELGDVSDQWTMGELVQSICILVVVNCQAHLCLACGVVPEPDTFGGACIKKIGLEHPINPNPSIDILPLFTSYDSRTFASPGSGKFEGQVGSSPNKQLGISPCIVIPAKSAFPDTESSTPIENDEDTIPNLLWKRRQSFNQAKLWSGDETVSNMDFDPNGVYAMCGRIEDTEDEVDAPATPVTPTSSPFWAAANLVRKSPGANGLLSPFPSYTELYKVNPEAATMPVNPVLEDMSRFYDTSNQVQPEEFDLTSREYPVLRLADCNWEEFTCSFIGRFVPELEIVLDQNLQEAREAAGDEDDGFFFSSENGTIDQQPLREAVWYYILRLYGIYNDGYEYRDVNLLLNKAAKKFLKKVCMRPNLISRQDWHSIGRGLKSQEKVLLALLATHARMYACLVYAFRYCQ